MKLHEIPLKEQYERLVQDKIKIDSQIGLLTNRIQQAKRKYKQNPRYYVEPTLLRQWEDTLTRSKQESQQLQRKIGGVHTQLKNGDAKILGEIFLDTARLMLPSDTFDKILERALEIRSGHIE